MPIQLDGTTGISTTGNIISNGTITATNIALNNINTPGNISAAGNITAGGSLTVGSFAAAALSASGNVTGGNILTAGLISAGGNVTGGNINAAGLSLSSNVVSALNVTGAIAGANLTTPGLISATGNITAGNITGANLLTDGLISAGGNITGGNLITAGLISATGNVTGGYFLGNGSQLTGIDATSIQNGNSNVRVVSSGGFVTVSVGGTANVAAFDTTGVYVTGEISASGNVTGANLVTAGLISAGANITGANLLTGGLISATGAITGANITGANVLTAGLISATGTITGANITGANILTAGLISATGTITGGNLVTAGNVFAPAIIGNTSTYDTRVSLNSAAGIVEITSAGNSTQFTPSGVINLGGASQIKGGVFSGSYLSLGASQTDLAQDRGGNVTVQVGTGGTIASTWTFAQGGSLLAPGAVSAVGNVTGGNVLTAGLISATGAITGANITGANLLTAGLISAGGNVTGGNIITAAAVSAASVSASGNITASNVIVGNLVFSTDTISSQDGTITIDPAAVGVTGLVIIQGNLQVNGNTTTINSNVVSTNDLTYNLANNAVNSAAANGGGIEVGPIGSPYITWLYNSTAGSWETAQGISATGNITGGNVLGGANVNATTHTGTTVSVSGNITGGNIDTAGLISATGAITGANITGANLVTAGLISATGNVTGGNINGTLNGSGANVSSISATNISTGTLDQARLANAAVTLGSTALTLGATVTTVAGLTSVTSTTFVGALTGAATTAGTVTTAAQGNITSVGTLTGLTINNATTAITNGATAGQGNIGASGAGFNTIFAKATSAQYADLAEKYSADADYAPGTVLIFGGDQEVTVSNAASDHRIAGVVSTNPAHLMNSELDCQYPVAIALTGRTPTRVTGLIHKGDLMVSAGNGAAMACATPVVGTVIGKALENFDGESGVIEVVVGVR
jgi:hypothetical protein